MTEALPDWVRAGQKVVCIDNTDYNGNADNGGWVQPALDTPYTIQSVNMEYPTGVPHIVIFELADHKFQVEDISVTLDGVWSGYDWHRFRPLVEDTTETKIKLEAPEPSSLDNDIEKHFKKLLDVSEEVS